MKKMLELLIISALFVIVVSGINLKDSSIEKNITKDGIINDSILSTEVGTKDMLLLLIQKVMHNLKSK